MLCQPPLWSFTNQMDLQSPSHMSTAGTLLLQLLSASHLATHCVPVAELSVLQDLDCLDVQRAWQPVACPCIALPAALNLLWCHVMCAEDNCMLCSGISTNFTRPTFPAGEIQPTDITHLQVGLTVHTRHSFLMQTAQHAFISRAQTLCNCRHVKCGYSRPLLLLL